MMELEANVNIQALQITDETLFPFTSGCTVLHAVSLCNDWLTDLYWLHYGTLLTAQTTQVITTGSAKPA